MTVAGVVLTGGASRRMGKDKATLLVEGVPAARRVAGVLRLGGCGPLLEVGPAVSGLHSVPDERPGAGPLAALATAVVELRRLGHTGAAVVVACDLPFLTPALIAHLASCAGTVVPIVAGRRQPLCARYGPDGLDAVPALVAAGARRMDDVLDQLAVHWWEEADWSATATERHFADVDTRADLVALGLDDGPA